MAYGLLKGWMSNFQKFLVVKYYIPSVPFSVYKLHRKVTFEGKYSFGILAVC